MKKENSIEQFEYCYTRMEDIIKHHKSLEIQEYAKQFAEIESPLVGGTEAPWIRINWCDIYIFLCNNGDIIYQVDPFGEYGGELLDKKNYSKESFIAEILKLESEEELLDCEVPMYIPMKKEVE